MKCNVKRPIRILFIVVYILLILFSTEFSSRLYLKFVYKIPILNTEQIAYVYYPELKKLDQIGFQNAHDLNVLILGASVLNSEWSPIENLLLNELRDKTNRTIKIYNLSQVAHTSRDSLIKYNFLMNKKFDLVIFYHGINELRANNFPHQLFKEDYSHYVWYEEANVLMNKNAIKYFSILWTLNKLKSTLKNTLFNKNYMPTDEPIDEWLKYGKNIKTANSFRKNISEIINMSLKKNESLILMTYAYFIPKDGSFNNFETYFCRSEYKKCNIKMWGDVTNIKDGLDMHNEVIHELANKYKNIIFIDQKRLIPQSRMYFNDICHLSVLGSEKFVENIMNKLDDIKFFRSH